MAKEKLPDKNSKESLLIKDNSGIDTKIDAKKEEGETNKKNLFIGGSLFLLIVAIFAILFIILYPELTGTDTAIESTSNISPDEKRLDEDISEIESTLSELDPNVDFVEFDDEDFATGTAEDELEEVIEEIDQVMNENESLESDFPDFDEEEF